MIAGAGDAALGAGLVVDAEALGPTAVVTGVRAFPRQHDKDPIDLRPLHPAEDVQEPTLHQEVIADVPPVVSAETRVVHVVFLFPEVYLARVAAYVTSFDHDGWCVVLLQGPQGVEAPVGSAAPRGSDRWEVQWVSRGRIQDRQLAGCRPHHEGNNETLQPLDDHVDSRGKTVIEKRSIFRLSISLDLLISRKKKKKSVVYKLV